MDQLSVRDLATTCCLRPPRSGVSARVTVLRPVTSRRDFPSDPAWAKPSDRMPEHPVHAARHTGRPDACRARSPKIPGHFRTGQIGGSITISCRAPRRGDPDGTAFRPVSFHSPGLASHFPAEASFLVGLGVVRSARMRVPGEVDQRMHGCPLRRRVTPPPGFFAAFLLLGVHDASPRSY